MELVLPMYNVHPYVSLKNLGKKNEHYTRQTTVTRLSQGGAATPSGSALLGEQPAPPLAPRTVKLAQRPQDPPLWPWSETPQRRIMTPTPIIKSR